MKPKDVSIDHLTLQFPGISAEQGRLMALEIAAALASAGAMPAAGDFPAIQVEMSIAAKSSRADLVSRVVSETLRQLNRGTS
jgi:hypothetical protein